MNLTLTIDHLRELDKTLLPPQGGWVTVKGNPYAPRGLRISEAAEKLAGVQHLNIYYGFGEAIPFDQKISIRLSQREWDMAEPKERHHAVREALEYVGVRDIQLTWINLATPYPETVRFYKGELSPASDEIISTLLAEGGIEVVRFDAHSPILEESVRDIIDSLCLDGLTFQQAQAECFTQGIIEADQLRIPSHFYRPTGWYKEAFQEESINASRPIPV